MKYITKIVLILCILCLICGCSTTAPGTDNPDQPADPGTTTPETNDPKPDAQNLLLDKSAKRNTAVLPRGIDKNHAWVKSTAGNTVTFYYPAEKDAFTYNNGKMVVGENTWLRTLSEEYDVTVHAVRKSAAACLSAQRMALLSGQSLDLLSFTPAQLPYARNMTADATALLSKQKESLDFLNPTLLSYGNNGKRFFSPAGIARNLWYIPQGSNSPLSLSEKELWDVNAFTNFINKRIESDNGKVTVYGYEAQDFTDILAAMNTPLIQYEDTFTLTAEAAKENLGILQKLNQIEGAYYDGQTNGKNAPALANGTLAMRYGQTPFVGNHDDYPKFEWAPLPTAKRHEGKGFLSACAPILALPKDGTKNEIALNVALLWSARFADANHDLLRFTYGMSFDTWQKYYYATIEQLQIVYAGSTGDTNALLRLITAPEWKEDQFAALCEQLNGTVQSANLRLAQ